MRRKILMTGFLSTLLVLVTFAGLATSIKLETKNEVGTIYNRNLINTDEAPLELPICEILRRNIQKYRDMAINDRARANETSNPYERIYYERRAEICDLFAGWYQYRLKIFQRYNLCD